MQLKLNVLLIKELLMIPFGGKRYRKNQPLRFKLIE
jgi:hypothetical protein